MLMRYLILAWLLTLSSVAQAYIGPGAGIGLLGSLWAWLAGVVVILLAVAIWPLRWLLRRLRGRSTATRDSAG